MTPTDPSALARARVLLDLRRYADALPILGPLVAARPDDAEPLLLLTRALAGVGRRDEALTSAEHACALVPERAYAHRLRAEVLIELGRFRPALQAAERSVELAPESAESHWVLARAAVARRQYTKAAREAEIVGQLAPGSELGFHACGYIAVKRHKWKAAEREYRSAVALDPQSPMLLNNLGLAVLHQGRTVEATDLFIRAGQLDATKDIYLKNTAIAAQVPLIGGKPVTAMRARVRGTAAGRLAWPLLMLAAFLVIRVAVATLARSPAGAAGLVVAVVLVVGSYVRRRNAVPETAQRAIAAQRRAYAARGRAELRPDWRRLGRLTLLTVGLGIVAILAVYFVGAALTS